MKYTDQQWSREIGWGKLPEKYKYDCPKCEDTGKIPFYKLEYAHVGGDLATKLTDCDMCNGEENEFRET